MSFANDRTVLFAAFAGTIFAFAGPASAFDFNNPDNKRTYCQLYAKQALADVAANQANHCGFSGAAWAETFSVHFTSCMAQSDTASTTKAMVTRSSDLQRCTSSAQADFPPVVADASPQSPNNFPPVVADEPARGSANPPPVVEEEAPKEPSSSQPPVVADAQVAGRTSSAALPPVADASDPVGAGEDDPSGTSDILKRGADAILSHKDEIRELVDFGVTHKNEIRQAAHLVKENIKQKLSELKQQNHHSEGARSLRSKVKSALAVGLLRHLSSR